MVALNFNASGVAPNTAREPVPTAPYPVVIVGSSEKPTKAGTGSYIELEMQIQGGEFNGRKVYDRLNIRNPNQTAVDIAYATLSAICHVTGRLHIQDTSQLHGVPFIAVVKKVERNDQPGSYTNEISGYKDINGNDPGFAGQVSQPAAQPQWAKGGAPAPMQQPQQMPPQQFAPQQVAPQQQQVPPGWGQPAAPQQAPQQPQWAAGPAPQQQPPAQAPQGQPAGQQPPPWAQGAA